VRNREGAGRVSGAVGVVAGAVLGSVVDWACVVARALAGGVSAAGLHVVGATMAVGVGLASFAAPVVV
jgi:hypothetical protein